MEEKDVIVEKKEADKDSWEYRLGRRVGSIAVYVFVGCCTAIVVGVTIKIMQWMLF